MFEHPVALMVSTSTYVVFAVGLTVGLDEFELYPEGILAHEYVSPLTALAPIVADEPEHIVCAVPVAAAGSELTVTFTELLFEQPVDVTFSVTVYEVVDVGLTAGFDDVEVNPDGLLTHEYAFPEIADEPIFIELPLQIEAFVPALADGNGFTVTTTDFVFEQLVIGLDSVKI